MWGNLDQFRPEKVMFDLIDYKKIITIFGSKNVCLSVQKYLELAYICFDSMDNELKKVSYFVYLFN